MFWLVNTTFQFSSSRTEHIAKNTFSFVLLSTRSNCHSEFKQTSKFKEAMNGEQPTEKSKWDYTEKFSRLPESEKKLSLLDEILDRISSINEYGPQLAKSNDWHINTNSSHSETKETSNFSRNWTVAPKLFPTNTIGYSCAQQNGISYSPDTSDLKTCRVYTDSKNKKNNWNSKSTELRPIGTKSASMSSIRTGYQNRHAFLLNESPVQSQPNVACKEVSKNVWNHDSSEKETFSNSSFSSIIYDLGFSFTKLNIILKTNWETCKC
jgi:hypothetical protein